MSALQTRPDEFALSNPRPYQHNHQVRKFWSVKL